MPHIQFSPDFGFDVTEQEATEATDCPDQTQFICVDDFLNLVLSLRNSPQRPGSSVLVTSRSDGDRVTIDRALRLYHDLCDDFVSLSPLELLERFVSRFGLRVRIGREGRLLFLQATVEIDATTKNELMFVENPQNHDYLIVSYIKMASDEKSLAVALAYVVDTDMYSFWLSQLR